MKELLAIVKFCRQYRHYLFGRFFVIRTVHNSIVRFTCFKNVQGQLARWLEELSQYDFCIQHRASKDHRLVKINSIPTGYQELETC